MEPRNQMFLSNMKPVVDAIFANYRRKIMFFFSKTNDMKNNFAKNFYSLSKKTTRFSPNFISLKSIGQIAVRFPQQGDQTERIFTLWVYF
jgi:hypothetical protein